MSPGLWVLVGLAVVLGPPVAEQPGFLAIGAETEVGDGADASPFEPLGHIARKAPDYWNPASEILEGE